MASRRPGGHCLAIHGGAGKLILTGQAALERAALESMRAALSHALDTGDAVLGAGGSALDAVVAAVTALEDAECFNAGRGAVLRSDESVRLDASVMCGRTRRAGAVAGARCVKNPVRVARGLLEGGGPVLVVAERADSLAKQLGLPLMPSSYFVTPERQRQWKKAREKGVIQLDHDAIGQDHDAAQQGRDLNLGAARGSLSAPGGGDQHAEGDDHDGQTVGAVALDSAGHLAAATSTGGMTNADPGRVGDSPIVGAGTWALDATCAVSATGTGEAFLRTAFAHGVHARLQWAGQPLDAATLAALADVAALGGEGGCVAIDRDGNVTLPFNTQAMPRAYRDTSGRRMIELS